jgi:predicted nucleic acid-binding protein
MLDKNRRLRPPCGHALCWTRCSSFPKSLATAIDMLLNHRNLVLQDPEVVAAALARFRRSPKLGFSDCMVLEAARKAGHVPLATLQKELSKLEDVERL